MYYQEFIIIDMIIYLPHNYLLGIFLVCITHVITQVHDACVICCLGFHQGVFINGSPYPLLVYQLECIYICISTVSWWTGFSTPIYWGCFVVIFFWYLPVFFSSVMLGLWYYSGLPLGIGCLPLSWGYWSIIMWCSLFWLHIVIFPFVYFLWERCNLISGL